MPRNVTVTFSDGSQHVYQNVPDDASPESVTERASSEFSKEVAKLDGGRKASPTTAPPTASAPKPSGPPPTSYKPIDNARAVAEQLFPGVRITDWKRDPNSPLGKANPDSWHNRSAAAIDMAPIPGMTYEQAREKFIAAGYKLIQDRDEVKNPAGHATGPHWHFVLGTDKEQQAPTDPNALPPVQETEIPGLPPPPKAPPQEEGNDIFRMPGSWQEAATGLGRGLGNIVEGAADTAGIIVDPINTALFRGLGYDGYTSDFGSTVRETLGLPEDNSAAGSIIRGATGGLAGAGLASALAKATPKAAAGVLKELGSTPVRDAVAGAGAAAGGEAAEAAGLGPEWQMGASLVGGLAGYGASGLPKLASEEARATRFANREAANNPNAAFDAEVALDIARAAKNTNISARAAKSNPQLVTKVLNNIEGSYTRKFADLLRYNDLHDIDRLRLKEALENRHSLSPDEIDGLRGTVQGDALADAITKVQTIRRMTEPHGRSDGLVSKGLKALGIGSDLTPGIPGIVGRGLQALSRQTADQEIARLAQARKLVSRNLGYKKLAEKVGPSGQKDSQEALWNSARDFIDGREAEAEMAKATRAEEAAARKAEADEAKVYRNDRRANVKMATENDPELQRRAARMKATQDFIKASEGNVNKFELVPDEAPPTREPTARERSAFRRGITSPELDPRDLTNPTPTTAQLASRVKARNSAVSKMEAKMGDWDAMLADPSTAPKKAEPKAPKPPKADPIQDAIDAAVSKGLKGDSRVQESFTTRLGISGEDLMRVLDEVKADNPAMAGEIDRIRLNHPTRSKMAGTALRPHLQAAMDKLGIKPAEAPPEAPKAPTVPIDEAAQQRLAAGQEVSSTPPVAASARELEITAELDRLDPVVVQLGDGGPGVRSSQMPEVYTTDPADKAKIEALQAELAQLRSAPADMRRINRPAAHTRGMEMFKQQANDSIAAMQRDSQISPQAYEALGNAPAQIRDNIRTVSEAEDYIVSRVLPDLEADGFSQSEIRRIQRYLFEVAQAKRYATPEALEEGLRVNGRGRPSSNPKSE